MQGWIKLHRELMDKPIWIDSTPEQKTILMTLLMLANHQEKQWEWKGQVYKIEPGQFITSLESIAQKSGKGVSVQNVRTALKRLEMHGFLTNKSTNKNRLITIVNWAFYQGSNEELTNKLTGSQQATNKQLTTNKKERMKEDKKNKYAEFVFLTLEEYEKLIVQFGTEGTTDRIERLSLYKGSTGKKYKSDYMTILNWEKKNAKDTTLKPKSPEQIRAEREDWHRQKEIAFNKWVTDGKDEKDFPMEEWRAKWNAI